MIFEVSSRLAFRGLKRVSYFNVAICFIFESLIEKLSYNCQEIPGINRYSKVCLDSQNYKDVPINEAPTFYFLEATQRDLSKHRIRKSKN